MTKIKPLTDEDFNRGGGDYFDVGVYEVVIAKAVREDPEGKAPFASLDVEGTDGQSTNVRLYLSPAAAPFSLSRLGAIAVHNKDSDKDKQAVRDAFKKIDDTDKVDNGFLAKFVDMQAWIDVYEDKDSPKPNGGYYKSTNIFGYEPKPRKSAVQKTFGDDLKPLDPTEIPFK